MQIYKGKTGLNETWQEEFPETMKCHNCGGEARIMFVGCENTRNDNFICDLHKNEGGSYWLHDACAVAVYLCKKCFEPNALINQA